MSTEIEVKQQERIIKIEQPSKYATINLALDSFKINKQVIAFVGTKRGAEKTAEDISKKVKLNKQETLFFEELSEKILAAIPKPTKQCKRLANCLKKGLAFHHAGLMHKQREIIEDNFREGKIKCICSTPTLALGIDLPAYRVIIKDLKRFSGQGWGGMSWIPVLEYLQMAGRAGRPKFETTGEAIAIASSEENKEEIFENYVKGEPEEVLSKLAVEPVLRSYVLSLIATGFVSNKKQLLEFFGKTFWAHQYQDLFKLENILDKILNLLDEYEFIQYNTNQDFVSAEDLGDEKINATLLGRRIAQLYIDPITAHHIITCLKRGASYKLVTSFGLLQMVSHTIEMRPLLRVRAKEYDIIQEQWVKHDSEMLEIEPSYFESDFDEFLNSIKTALFLKDWISEIDEEVILENYNTRPGETRMKIDRADWLLYCAEELAKL
ncbi:hypothetical protein HON01_07270, partial [Candidatus Woesearchaeota archaeon]|nr:hypothetical protein [Candidatus Woesearchaeota archaeon]